MTIQLLILAFVLQIADGPVIGNASFIEWDYTVGGVEDEFRVHCGPTPGVTPGVTPTAVVVSPVLEWAVSNLAGQQYCITTAFDTDTQTESAPSNEIAFFVLPAPTNNRLRP